MKTIVLTDGKAGHENQSKAFARALGLDFEIVPVKFKSPFHKALSYLLDFIGVRTLSLLEFQSSGETLLTAGVAIGTGSGTFYAAKALAAKGAKCGVVLYPRGYRLSGFDCILAPSFDSPAKRPNVVEIPANIVANDAAFYEKGVAAFRERYAGSVDNLACVIVGGPNKCSTMTVEWMKERLDAIFAENPGSELCVTTSRRTPPSRSGSTSRPNRPECCPRRARAGRPRFSRSTTSSREGTSSAGSWSSSAKAATWTGTARSTSPRR